MTEIRLRSGGLGPYDLRGKVAVVTGASSGIGAATARALARAGAQVVAGYNSGRERADDVVRALPGDGHQALHLPIEDTPALEAAAAEVSGRFGAVHVLVNSAGSTAKVAHADLEAMTDELFDAMLRTNVRGPFAVTRTFVPLLRASGDAVVVNISSISGMTASGSNVGYCAAKAALDNLTMSLGRALGPAIRFVGVAPAAVETDFVAGRGRDAIAAQAASTPLKVLVHPDDIADAVLGVVRNMRVATGTTFVVDGGKHL
ncbi:SDR family oxidoreductase [Actinomadura graeca]|uniref:SDR family oxidoreductase n=1 Tax=Actinomadura graeca TaxID=2750812 RepID=A0ABX8QR12_9ACTN|nr:SDR family oxidoreductase [Actinomadura graeca]QXJ21136.1 SDR family oxidoreductase [Actinomadura graeca]